MGRSRRRSIQKHVLVGMIITIICVSASRAIGILPLPFLPGRHVRHWNPWAWMVLTTIGLIGFVAVLPTPGSGSPSELRHVALVP